MSTESKYSSPPLTNKGASKFWEDNFQDKDSVANGVFQDALIPYIEELIEEHKDPFEFGSDDIDRKIRLFTKQMASVVFWSTEDLLAQNSTHVDKSCVQFAINTFGPWSRIFQTVHAQLFDKDQELKPMEFFHGRTGKDILDKKIKTAGDFALRYDEAKNGGLVLSWAKGIPQGVLVKDENVRRRKLKKTKKKAARVVWTYNEKVAIVGGVRVDGHDFSGLGEFLNYKKGTHKSQSGSGVKQILEPVTYGSAYQTFGLDSTAGMSEEEKAQHLEQKKEEKAQVDAAIDGMNLDGL